jgi:Raf kinase inhibitor-like YbhB/YbcL family protein
VRKPLLAAALAAAVVAAAALYLSLRERETLDTLLEKARKGSRFEVVVAGLSGGSVPVRYTCDGEDVSPRVEWRGLPAGARSLALICYDPDAPRGTFVHWVLYNVPPSLPGLPENLPKTGVVEGVGLQGVNDFGRVGYGGPCPPSGTHRYVFLVLALDSELKLREGASAFDVLREALPHVIGYGEVVLRYSRG